MKNLLKNNWHKLTLVGIVLLGVFLRLYILSLNNSFSFDEIISSFISQQPLENMWEYLKFENSPPLHFILLRLWGLLFGVNDFTLRFFSVLTSALSIIAIYFLGKQLFTKNVGLLSATILSVSLFDVAIATTARMYSLFTLLTILSFLFFWKIFILEKKQYYYILAYILVTTLALYTHITGLEILAIQGLFILMDKKSRIYFWKFLSISIIILLLFYPWIHQFLIQKVLISQEGLFTNSWYFNRSEIVPVIISAPVIYIFNLLYFEFPILNTLNFFLILIVFILYLINTIHNSNKNKPRFHKQSEKLFLIAFLLPLLISTFTINTPSYRYYIPSSIAFFILVAHSIYLGILSLHKKYFYLLPFGIGLVIILIFANVKIFRFSIAQPYQELATQVDDSSIKTVLVSPVSSAIQFYTKTKKHFIPIPPSETTIIPITQLNLWQYAIKYNWTWHNWEDPKDSLEYFENILKKILPPDLNEFIFLENNSFTDLALIAVLQKNGFCTTKTTYIDYSKDKWTLYEFKKMDLNNNVNCLEYAYPQLQFFSKQLKHRLTLS